MSFVKKNKEIINIKTGYFSNGQPYVKFGKGSEIIINIDALTFKNEPPSGFELNQLKKIANHFPSQYTFYNVGRRPNLPDGFLFEKMAKDYADLIQSEFQSSVIVMGTSTGGQIAQYLAANHPDTIKKLVLISTAYKLSEQGVKYEAIAESFFIQGKYGKCLASMLDFIFPPGMKRGFMKFITRMLGKWIIGKIKYPNDFLLEIQGDREMNFKDHLSEILAPTLVISGKDDVLYNIQDVKLTADGIPNAKLLLYSDYGHNLMMKQSKKVIFEVIEFLNTRFMIEM